ncbi:MAG: precorrin-3B C(17)-methyltransferase [Rhodomicrobium sp.]
MSGRLTVIGLGPGPSRWMTPAAQEALDGATDIFGYRSYVERIPVRAGQRVHASDNRVELQRAGAALAAAQAGCRAVLVSGGDPGVFAMAAAVFEAIERGPSEWRALDVAVEPGVTAMLAAAARIGAPLGHDFCAISLSDNLKPWSAIEKRLRLACEADFAIALYNPASLARPGGVHRAFEVLRQGKPGTTVIVFARAIGREDERVAVTTLELADPGVADMQTLVLVGSSATKVLPREGGVLPWVYTPRSMEPL